MIELAELAQRCAPDIPTAVIVAIANKESSGNRFAVGHASIPQAKQPQTFGEAVRIMDKLAMDGQRYDAGIMQISSSNFAWLGLDNVTAMDACKNIAAAQTLIKASIRTDNPAEFFNAVSRYNSGNEKTGYKNGYVTDVAVNLLNPPAGTPMQQITETAPPYKTPKATGSPVIANETLETTEKMSQEKWGKKSNRWNNEKNAGLFTRQKQETSAAVVASAHAKTENDAIFSVGSREDEIYRVQRLGGSHQQGAGDFHAAKTSAEDGVALRD